jgi:nucleoside-diphosphate-sugar epimerase
VIITGASGFIGSALVPAFVLAGWEVFELGRQPSGRQGTNWLPFDLRTGVIPALPAADLTIHAAYDFRAVRWSEINAFNVQGTWDLFEKCRDTGIPRFIFVSSMAAFPGCRSLYGRAKLETERRLLAAGAVVVRPGFVIGPGARGLARTIQTMASRLPVVPVIGYGRQRLLPCHVDDLCQALLKLSESAQPKLRPVLLAARTSITLAELVRHIGRVHNHHVMVLPVPAAAIRWTLAIAEWWGVKLPLRSDSVVSLTHQNPMPFDGVDRLAGVTFRELHDVAMSDAQDPGKGSALTPT